jgi:hypothetical protein
MSRNWVGCLNHKNHNSCSLSYCQLPVFYLPLPVQILGRVASLWPLAVVAGAETHYIYELDLLWPYEVDGMPQYIFHVRNEDCFDFDSKHISGWGCILMTTSRSSWCWNTWHVYKLDLLWVWSGWDASIMTYSIIQVRNQENHLQLHLTVRPSMSGWGCILMTASRSIRCGNTLYMYEVNLV